MKPKMISLTIVCLLTFGSVLGLWTNNASARPGDDDEDGLSDTDEQTTYRKAYENAAGVSLYKNSWSTPLRYFSSKAKVSFDCKGYFDAGGSGNVGKVDLTVDSTIVATVYCYSSSSWVHKEMISPSTYTGKHQVFAKFTALSARIFDPDEGVFIFTYGHLNVRSILVSGMTDYQDPDFDDDTMGDGEEVHIYTTNPMIADSTYNPVKAVPLKTGSVAMITWDSGSVQTGFVDYGPTTSYGTRITEAQSAARHAVQLTGLTVGIVYHYRIGKVVSDVYYYGSDHTFMARNAMNTWDGTQYTVNMLVSIEIDDSSTMLTTWASRMSNLATFLYDALDGKMRVGTVIVVDNNQFAGISDVRVRMGTTRSYLDGTRLIPYDDPNNPSDGYFTPSGTLGGVAIAGINSNIEMPYFGPQWNVKEVWWPTDVWHDGLNDLTSANQTTGVLMHEFGHYGLWIQNHNPSRNDAGDWSFMSETRGYWVGTKYHSYTELQPSDGAGAQEEWDIVKSHYTSLTATTTTTINTGPNGNGDAFSFLTINRGTL